MLYPSRVQEKREVKRAMNAHTQLAPAQIVERWLTRFNAAMQAIERGVIPA
jgi:hypothetical protein